MLSIGGNKFLFDLQIKSIFSSSYLVALFIECSVITEYSLYSPNCLFLLVFKERTNLSSVFYQH